MRSCNDDAAQQLAISGYWPACTALRQLGQVNLGRRSSSEWRLRFWTRSSAHYPHNSTRRMIISKNLGRVELRCSMCEWKLPTFSFFLPTGFQNMARPFLILTIAGPIPKPKQAVVNRFPRQVLPLAASIRDPANHMKRQQYGVGDSRGAPFLSPVCYRCRCTSVTVATFTGSALAYNDGCAATQP